MGLDGQSLRVALEQREFEKSVLADEQDAEREERMKKKSLTIIILFWGISLLISCAGLNFIPEGSRSLGVYDGYFYGVRYGGSIRVYLFQTPEGDKLFTATIALEPNERENPKALFVRGKMTANSLEGAFQGNANGTLTGQLSSNGNQLTGSINLTAPDLNDGTWKAQKSASG
jgi:hypothetical protein